MFVDKTDSFQFEAKEQSILLVAMFLFLFTDINRSQCHWYRWRPVYSTLYKLVSVFLTSMAQRL